MWQGAGFPWKMIIYQDAKKFSKFNFISVFIIYFYFKFRSGLILYLFLNIMKLVLSMFRDSLFIWNNLIVSLIHYL